jgi:EAL domain-containing protein (putative c-di-GMP-specific phosphodiesterase class I)
MSSMPVPSFRVATVSPPRSKVTRIHGVADPEPNGLLAIESACSSSVFAIEGPSSAEANSVDHRFGKALEGLWIAFQPIVAWGDRRIYGYEALVRTTEPTMKSPLAFFDAAEKLGRERELSRAIRARAAAVAPPDGARLFVNLHASDLGDEELYSPLSPLTRVADRVVLEITERMSLDHVDDLDARITKLRTLGFRVAVDDLGAGYAGLSSFAQLEPDVAKVDMSLIRDVHAKPKKQSIVRSLQRLCVELGILLVAEGVESREERDTLISLGCDLFQGYLLAKPGPAFPTPDWT